jgi:branched-chain amino acid transport system substrate-binding protein
MKSRIWIYALLVVVLALSACAPAQEAGAPEVCSENELGCAVVEPGQTIKIGMGGPMTGDYASFGVDISQGAQLAVEDFGEFNGWNFELISEDTQGSPEIGATVANKLVSDATVVAIAGHIFSGETEAAMPIYEKAGFPMLSPSATNPPLTELGSAVFNRIAFTDAVQAADSSAYMFNTLGVTKLAILHDGGAYGKGLADLVQVEWEALGGEVVYFDAITIGETDYTSILSSVAASSPEALYYGGYVGEAVVLANQMDQSGLEGVTFFGCDGTFGSEFTDKTGANGEGAYAASLVPPESEAKTAFDAAYQEKYGVGAGQLSPYTWSGYDVAAALIEQVKAVAIVGDDGNLYVPRQALVDAVRGMSGVQYLTGEITCGDTGECNTAGPTLYVVQNGEWVIAP